MLDIFSQYYQTNYWGDDESVSGRGSNLEATEVVRKELPRILRSLEVNTLLDIPCGDYYWFSRIKGLEKVKYIGLDIVPELIRQNQKRYPGVTFRVGSVIDDELPPADLVLVRDLFGHFSNHDVQLALRNLKDSGSTYLLATTFPDRETKGDIETGQWRPINLASYFGLPDPIMLLNEHCTAGNGEYSDKSLGLWKLDVD